MSDFVKKLMGQIVFLYFLQKKGWLGVKPGEKWGSGDKKFMHNLFHKKYCEYENFYNDVLEPLFYNTLNNRDRQNSSVINDQSYSPFFKCRIPYLNGGLFTPVYDWIKSKIFIDNKYFQDIFDVFDTFNFTVFESDPIEKEVAVDPEMLGKVFENLLEIRDRKSKGAFYTPREIVHYMCQESIIHYLVNKSGYPEERIRKLMQSKDQELARTKEQALKLAQADDLKEIASKVNGLLKNIKVCDPAVGSGAFPMGLLKEISTTRFFLNKYFLKERNNNNVLFTEYDIKKETLENCIYGVDIDSGAVEIARLRFWLSLVVEHDIEEIEPLPNLDYKIMQGNSLIELLSPTLTSKTNDENRNKLIDRLKNAKAEYFNLSTTSTKREKREEINILTRNLINYDKEKERNKLYGQIQDKKNQLRMFSIENEQQTIADADFYSKLNSIKDFTDKDHFEWHLNFNEVFDKGGFDIVIGNPPYIQLQKAMDSTKKYADLYKDLNFETFERTGDIYSLFYEKGISLLKERGCLAFITSNKWMRAGYGKTTRAYFARHNPIKLIDLGSGIFDSATVDTNILLIEKSQNKNSCFAADLSKTKNAVDFENLSFVLMNNLLSDSWLITSEIDRHIKSKIEAKGIPLKNWDISINRGILTGYNQAFIIDGNKKDYLIAQDPKCAEIIKPILRGRDIKRYKAEFANLWLINSHNGLKGKLPRINVVKDYPAIYQHLKQFEPQLIKRQDQGDHWTNLRNCAYVQEFEREKIVFQEMVQNSSFLYDYSSNYFCLDTGRIITGHSLRFLISIFNSKLFFHAVKNYYGGGGLGEAGVRMKHTFFENYCIPHLSEVEQMPFIDLVEQIQVAKKQNKDTSEYESQIDQMVYKLYGLTEEEIKIVENS